jgi:membrane protease subunit (stomatin/prohibitin family)
LATKPKKHAGAGAELAQEMKQIQLRQELQGAMAQLEETAALEKEYMQAMIQQARQSGGTGPGIRTGTAKFCAHCGGALKPHARFCSKCGASIT